MSTLEIISLVARIQVGTRIACNKSTVLRVTEISEKGFICVNEYGEKLGMESKGIIWFDMFTNPHYNKCYKIID